ELLEEDLGIDAGNVHDGHGGYASLRGMMPRKTGPGKSGSDIRSNGARTGFLDPALQVVHVLGIGHHVGEIDDPGLVELQEVVVEQDHAVLGAGLDGRIDAEAL